MSSGNKLLVRIVKEAISLIVGLNFNGENAVADGGIKCDCAIFGGGCYANGWGATCVPDGTIYCWLYYENCKNQPE